MVLALPPLGDWIRRAEGVAAAGGEQDGGADLAIVALPSAKPAPTDSGTVAGHRAASALGGAPNSPMTTTLWGCRFGGASIRPLNALGPRTA